jgi:DNA-directed RNA polymerase-5 subunit 1
MKMVAKEILKDHLVLVADSMMNTGIKKRFNNAGYKATFRHYNKTLPTATHKSVSKPPYERC